jgi:hypothetical protein
MAIRYLYRFESADGLIGKTWPTNLLEYEQEQELIASSAALAGADYQFDQLGAARSLKGIATERVRFMVVGSPSVVDSEIDEIKALANIGRGKVWTKGDGGVYRWAWARLQAMLQNPVSYENVGRTPVSLSFTRFSDWHDEEPLGYEGEFMLDADPDTVIVTNPGNAEVYDAVIIVKGTFDGLRITNNSALLPDGVTPYVLETTSTGAGPDDWIRFDAGRNAVEISSDGGATWADDSANFVRQDGQARLMVMSVVANELVIEGANGCDLVVEMYGAWH